MSGLTPTPQQAQASLAEAATWSGWARKADKPLSLILLVLAAMYLAVGAVVAISFAYRGPAIILILGAGIASIAVLFARIRAYSRMGNRRFLVALGVFSLWNATVVGASVVLGWYAPGSSPWHFTVSAAVASLPLLAAAVLIGRRAR